MQRDAERVGLLLVRHRRLDRLQARRRSRSRTAPAGCRRTTAARGPRRVRPGTSDSRTWSVSIAIVSWSASRTRLMIDDGLRGGDVEQPAEVRARGRRRGGRACGCPAPCRGARMSSVKEVIVSSCAIFGSLTNVPLPWRRTSIPSRTRSSSAARTVRRETPRSVQSWRSEGIASPTPSCSIRSRTLAPGLALLRHGSRLGRHRECRPS